MFMKKIATAAAFALCATGASAVTQLTVADAQENGGLAIDILADEYQFQETFAAGSTGPLSFLFENNSPTVTTIVISAGSIGQTPLVYFTGGASIDWATAGNVTSASQGNSSGGNLTFQLAANSSDTLVLTFGAAVENKGQQPDIDFFVSTVPVPAGVLLMGTALAGFGVAARRKRRKS